ncbi:MULTISPECIES: hypothetical protein [unclassified Nocardioides]|uniref:hypothetical protein n=1 Tax=unclassified Nocardioides TaxID=2615069 RepID=UPI000056FBC8|nr:MULTISPECIES: hypothetical protein [unclassified Nocardioides]ABL80550.1 hypothetical protein Noca_1031 [Nocardioides sp. JS614]
MPILLILAACLTVLGTGLVVPELLKAVEKRRRDAELAARQQAKEARRLQRQSAKVDRRARRAAAAERQLELDEIRSDPHRYLYRMMLAALPRIIRRRGDQAAASVAIHRATGRHQAASKALADFDEANRWVTSETGKKVVLWGQRLALPVFGFAILLDGWGTTAAFEGPLGYVLAPAFVLLMALASIVVCWGLALFDQQAKAFSSSARGLAATGGALLFIGSAAMMMNWAPAGPAKVYDPQIRDAQIAVADLQRKPNSADLQAQIDALNDPKTGQIATLQARERNYQHAAQWAVLVLALGDAIAAEALMLAPLIRRREQLRYDVDLAQHGIQDAEDNAAEVENAIRTDVTIVADAMTREMTAGGHGLPEIQQMVADTLVRQRDLTLFRELLTGEEVANVADNAMDDHDTTPRVVPGEVVDDRTPPAPTPPAEQQAMYAADNTPGTGYLPAVVDEEVRMPDRHAARSVNLDDLDQSL